MRPSYPDASCAPAITSGRASCLAPGRDTGGGLGGRARRRWRAGASLAIAVTVLAGAACASGYRPVTPSASVTTTSPAVEQWFRVKWEVRPDGPSARRIDGYVYNSYGRPAENVRVLVQALDVSGAVTDQRLAWVPGGVPQVSRAYFEVDRLPVADHYRVTVWSFDFRRVSFRVL